MNDWAIPSFVSFILEKLVRSTRSVVGGVILCFLVKEDCSKPDEASELRGRDGIIFVNCAILFPSWGLVYIRQFTQAGQCPFRFSKAARREEHTVTAKHSRSKHAIKVLSIEMSPRKLLVKVERN